MKLEEMHKSWEQDATIDRDNLGEASLRIPNLHSKYLTMLSNERLKYKLLTDKLKILGVKLFAYYDGKTDGKDIGRPPFQLKLPTKDRVQQYVEADAEYQKMGGEVSLSEEKMLFLKEVITNINQRNFQVRNGIDWAKFVSGA